jgi:nitronate monooxygenase
MLSGSIADGTGAHAARVLGTTPVFMGTRFVSTVESDAQITCTEMIIGSEADNIILTSLVRGLPGNWMRESQKHSGYTDFKSFHRLSHFNFAEKKKTWRVVWGVGHGTGTTKAVTTLADIVVEFEREYRKEKESQPE